LKIGVRGFRSNSGYSFALAFRLEVLKSDFGFLDLARTFVPQIVLEPNYLQ